MSRPFLISLALSVLTFAPLGFSNGAPVQSPGTTIRVVRADAPTIKKAIAAQKGHVVLVDFWATWCGPCVAEFPELVKLHKKYRRQGLVVIAVSQDSARDIPGKVAPFLKKQKADFSQYLEQADDPGDFINAFDPRWQGDLPRTFIYNRQGRLVKEFGVKSPKGFEAALKAVLRK